MANINDRFSYSFSSLTILVGKNTLFNNVQMKDNYKSRIMKNLFNYWFKTNKKSLYDQLGKEFNVSGFRVYKLAHGKTAHSHMDRLILEKLLELKIISEIEFRI